MNYFRINFTTRSKTLGTNGGYIKDYIFRFPEDAKPRFYWEEPKFIGNIWDRMITFKPYTVDVVIAKSARLLDLIKRGGPLSAHLLISSRLKDIFEKYRSKGYQCFQFNVLQKNVVNVNYWTLHFYEFNQEFIDFQNCVFLYDKQRDDYGTSYLTEQILLHFDSKEEFEAHKERTKEKGEITTIKNLRLKDDITEDFFALKGVEGGIGYFVSETVKNEIENAGCRGIEFQPGEMSFNEWTTRDGLRDEIYGRSW